MPNRSGRRQKLKAAKKATKKLGSALPDETEHNNDALGSPTPAIVLSEAPPRLEPQSVFVDKPPDKMATAEQQPDTDISSKSAAMDEELDHNREGDDESTRTHDDVPSMSSASSTPVDSASKSPPPATSASASENVIQPIGTTEEDRTPPAVDIVNKSATAEEEQAQHDHEMPTTASETEKYAASSSDSLKGESVEPNIPLPEISTPPQLEPQVSPLPRKEEEPDFNKPSSSSSSTGAFTAPTTAPAPAPAQPPTNKDESPLPPPPIEKSSEQQQAMSGASVSSSMQQAEQAVSAAITAAVASATVAAKTERRDAKQKGLAVSSPRPTSTSARPPATPEKDVASIRPLPKDQDKKSGGGFWNLFKSSSDKKKSWQFWK